MPLPLPMVTAIAASMWRAGLRRAGLGVIIAISAYLRPGELLSLKAKQIVAPAPAAGVPCWSLLLFPEEDGRPSKTGHFSTVVLLDNPRFRFIDPVLEALKSRLAPDAALIDMSYPHFARALRQAADRVGVQTLQPAPYSLRHSGASLDMLDARRSIPEIKMRGRWQADGSMVRYVKGGRVAEQWGKLSAGARLTCGRFHDGIGKTFLAQSPL